MKKHWGMHLFVVGFMLVYTWTVFADRQPEQDLGSTQEALVFLTQAMEQTGAETKRIQLHYGSAYDTFDRVEEVKEFAEKLGIKMGLTKRETGDNNEPSASLHEGDSPSLQEFHFYSLKDHVLTNLQVHAMPSHIQSKAWDSYIILNISTNSSDLPSIQKELDFVYKVLGTMQIFPQFYTCVQGNLNDKLENDVQMKTMNDILNFLGAEVVEKVEDSTVKSYSAFTSKLSSYIMTDGRKMNVQAGMHVDQLHGITRLTIGTPIITIEY